jgi:hypothetical protein
MRTSQECPPVTMAMAMERVRKVVVVLILVLLRILLLMVVVLGSCACQWQCCHVLYQLKYWEKWTVVPVAVAWDPDLEERTFARRQIAAVVTVAAADYVAVTVVSWPPFGPPAADCTRCVPDRAIVEHLVQSIINYYCSHSQS